MNIKEHKKSKRENRRKLAIMMTCMTMLHLSGVLTDSEEKNVFIRIKKFQDKNEIEISEKQLDSVNFKYKD